MKEPRIGLIYPAREVEQHWQKYWQKNKVFRTNPNPKRKYYVLVMFIYPSGDMHMGHARNYTIGDCICRFRKMQGYDVLHPFGWDSFGLPAENAAIKHDIHPAKWTFDSIDLCKRNLNLLGIAYDWDREVTTCKPEYYRWNQWLFLQFYKKGLAYRKEAFVNWCPCCQTVLANEQVVEGHCYRCNAVVERKKLTQWFLRITDYAQELLDGIDGLVSWPESVKTMQRNWIGRSSGIEVKFKLEETGEDLPVFTTRPDTLWGVTFMALAPDAPLAERIAQGTGREKQVKEFIGRVLMKPEVERVAAGLEKEGIFTGKYAVNPVNQERVPIYIADFVLASYGTGMIMAVPAHDQRDFEFAKKYEIPIKVVIQPEGKTVRPDEMKAAFIHEGVMTNSGLFDGKSSKQGIELVTRFLEEKGLGKKKVNYRLKDWLISRQRYWGTPIPMIQCDKCGVVPVPEENLPVTLPENVHDYKPKGKSVLANVPEFYNTTCPRCGGKAFRDPDTMDTFVDSSWYHLRYTDPKNTQLPFAKGKADMWLPIDEYIGGIEHATGHLVFFRFFTRVLADMGMLSIKEPCKVLHTQGMVSLDGKTMSSSKKHGVWVGPFIKKYGADAARLGLLFAAPPEKSLDWTEDLVTGVVRFLNRVWRLFEAHIKVVNFRAPEPGKFSRDEHRLYVRLNQTHKKVITDTEGFQFNTAIAAQMEFLNDLYAFKDKKSPVFGFSLGKLLYLLAPFAPHLAEELWHRVRPDAQSIFQERFPDYDRGFTNPETMTVPVMVDGKLRSRIVVPRTTKEDEIKHIALADRKVAGYLTDKQMERIIYVKDRLVNIVTAKK